MMPHVWGARLHCVGARLHCVAATPLMASQRVTRPLEVVPHVPQPATVALSKPRAAPALVVSCCGRHPDCRRCPRTWPCPETRRGAPAAIAGSTTLGNGRMCTADIRLAKLHHDTKRNERERTTQQRSQQLRSMRNSENGLWKTLATDRNKNYVETHHVKRQRQPRQMKLHTWTILPNT